MGFQVKEEVRMGLEFDWAIVGARVVLKRSRVGSDECVEKDRILWSWWDKTSDL